jgi:hypothetical protein
LFHSFRLLFNFFALGLWLINYLSGPGAIARIIYPALAPLQESPYLSGPGAIAKIIYLDLAPLARTGPNS